MKKIFAILFSIFYFGLSSGAAFSVHYCMDELVSIGQKPSENCNVCGVKKKDDCCKTELKIVKTDQPQKSDLLKLSFTNYILEPVQQVFKKVEFSIFKTEITTIQANAPPESASVPIFIQHCQYRI